MDPNTNLQQELKAKEEAHYAVKASGELVMNVKDVDPTTRKVRVVLNAFNFLDSDNDILMNGCCKKSIKERGPDSAAVAKIKHFKDHDPTKVPGRFVELEECEESYKGQKFACLAGTIEMSKTTLGTDQLISYQEGIIDNHSIGFQYTNIKAVERSSKEFDKIIDGLVNPKAADGKNWVFVVKEVELYEGSSVAFGANSLTPYLGVKSMNPDSLLMKLQTKMDQLSQTLRAGNQSDGAMHTFELQVLQIKQMMKEIFAMKAADPKEKAIEAALTPALPLGGAFSRFSLR